MTAPKWWQQIATDGKHPVWTIAQIGVVTAAALVLSYANATTFDGGEIKTVLGTSVATWLATRMRGA